MSVFLFLVIFLLLIFLPVFIRFHQEKTGAIREITSKSSVVNLPQGQIEYWSTGNGPVVLILHGGGSGFDIGPVLSHPEWGFRFLAVSRPGYLNTPIVTGVTPEAQAEAFTVLMDTLDIKDAVVWCLSGGGPPALAFALRYPGRCRGLIMQSAISLPVRGFPKIMEMTTGLMHYTDFIPWMMLNTPLAILLSRPKVRSQLKPPKKRELFLKITSTMFPVSQRIKGAINDTKFIHNLPDYPLHEIACPTLVIHGTDDTIVPFRHAQYSAQNIPKAHLLPIPDGDHLCYATHQEMINTAIHEFLQNTASSEPSTL